MPNWKKVIVSGSDACLNSLNVQTSTTSANLLITDSAVLSGSIESTGSLSHIGDSTFVIRPGKCFSIQSQEGNNHVCYDRDASRLCAYLIGSQNFLTGADGRSTFCGNFIQLQSNAYLLGYQQTTCMIRQYPSSGATLQIANCNSITAPAADYKLLEFDNCGTSVGHVTVSGSAYFCSNVSSSNLLVTDTATITNIESTGSLTVANTTINGNLHVSGSVVSYLHKNEQTDGYTLALSDLGKMVEVSSSSAVEIIIPTNESVAFPTGSQIMVARYGSGDVAFSTSATLRSVAGESIQINSQYGAVTLVKRDTDEWYAFGDISAS